MNSPTRSRDIVRLSEEVVILRAVSERLGEVFTGLCVLFVFLAATVVVGGVAADDPVFALGAGLSLAAAAAFGICAHELRSARRPQVQPLRVAALSRRFDPMRRAA
jgi:hypothetical protein